MSKSADQVLFENVDLPAGLNDAILRSISHTTVGLVPIIKTDTQEDGEPVGTATLVSVDGIFGLLTAAHVLDVLPQSGLLGIVRFANDATVLQGTKLDMGFMDRLAIGKAPYSNLGPDLGFLRLAQPDIARLLATNVFFNLTKSRPPIEGRRIIVFALAGVVAEYTNLVENTPERRVKSVEGHVWPASLRAEISEAPFDVHQYALGLNPGEEPPASYGGTSGAVCGASIWTRA
jgi:hypothetical protein